jgi:Cu/Ag efflux pump CusA
MAARVSSGEGRTHASMQKELDKIPGVLWNFSQPIADNMEEAVSGVKGQIATKIYGEDLKSPGSEKGRDHGPDV